MEFPKLGVQCSSIDCQQLDFLPYECACEEIFCGEHFNKHLLICKTRKDVIVNEPKLLDDLHQCSHIKCKVQSLILIECPMCGRHFCIRHRHINDCEEKSETIVDSTKVSANKFNEAKAAVDEELDANLEKAKRKPRTANTANKVQLLRLKQKAIGTQSIPVANRIYFIIDIPSPKSKCNVPIFISRSWTLGKTIDSIAELSGLINNNNIKGVKKLRLFHKINGTIVGDPADVIDILLKGEHLANGDNLILEYVNDDVIQLK